MNPIFARRQFLQTVGLSFLGHTHGLAQGTVASSGRVIGQPAGARAGEEILAAGGNAVDATVTAALVAGVVAISGCGPGGYGGHMVIATGDGRRVTAIDFNSAAPRSARPDMFPLGADGRVEGAMNAVGWRAVGVPGTLAGLQLALERYGTLPFRQVVQPAIRHAREGIILTPGLATAIRNNRALLARDRGIARLLLPGGNSPQAGERFHNPDLVGLLENLARQNSVESFYRGEIGQRLADAFAQHDGQVTAMDLASYRALELQPLELSWRGYSIRTAPLPAGGFSVLEALAILRLTDWENRDPAEPRTTHLRVESLRAAWQDRLRYLGDRPDVPVRRLLSEQHTRAVGAQVETAVREGRRFQANADGRPAGGTIHLSAVDATGMMVALTLTHGESFGAKVAVDGLGLILGHGMSRFDPHPEHPNAPGPGKRPLTNMCPTVILKEGRPVLALGGQGGRRIPNAVFDVLTHYVGRGKSLHEALAAPRMHTEGGTQLTLERAWPQGHVDYLRQVGYQTQTGASAIIDAVSIDPRGSGRIAEGR